MLDISNGSSSSSSSSSMNCSSISVGSGTQLTALATFQELYRPVHASLCTAICIFGAVANSVNIAVLTSKCMRASSVNVILFAIAVSDLLTMLLYLPHIIHFSLLPKPTTLPLPHTQSQAWITYSLCAVSVLLVLHTAACWLTVVLAVFRLLYIALPANGAALASTQRARVAIISTVCVLIVCTTPNYLVNAVHSCSTHNATVVFFLNVANEASQQLVQLNYWMIALLHKIIPCLLLLALTAMLLTQLSKASKRRQRLVSRSSRERRDPRRDSREHRTTVMLLAIVVVFLVTELPQGIMTLLCFLIPSFQSQVYAPTGDLLDLLSLINNSVNFVLYTSMSKQFRDTFTNMLVGRCLLQGRRRRQKQRRRQQQLQQQQLEGHDEMVEFPEILQKRFYTEQSGANSFMITAN